MEFISAAQSQTIRDIKAQPGLIQTVLLLDLNQMEIQASLPLVNLAPKASQAQTVEEKKKENILLVHTLKRKTKVLQSAQTLMKGLLVTQNPTVIQDTPLHVHPDRIAEGHGQGHDRGHEGLGLVHLTPDWTDLEVNEALALSDHIIMTLTEGHTGALRAGSDGVHAHAHARIKTEIVRILRTTAEKQEHERVNQADHQRIRVHTKSLDPLLM